MATRFYLPSTGAAAISPAFSTRWEDAAVGRNAMVKTRINSAMTNRVTSTHPGTTSNQDYAARQYVYGPIAAQTITGTIKGRIRALESSTSANVRAYMVLRIVDSGGTERAELFFGPDSTLTGNPTSEFAASLTSRRFPWNTNVAILTGTLTSGSSLAGDYLVAEFGGRFHNASLSGRTCTLNFGDDSATDLAEDEATTAAHNPWIELSFDVADDTGTPLVYPDTTIWLN